jgi:hypothetical protein
LSFSPLGARGLTQFGAVDSDGLKAKFRLPGKNFEDLGSLRIKPTFAEPFAFLSSSHSGCPYQSADFVALVPRLQTLTVQLISVPIGVQLVNAQ